MDRNHSTDLTTNYFEFRIDFFNSVDRFPLVTSAIINVDQDVDEPWPLEVYGHDGMATNVTMEPGDMVLYESHSVVHGRPFPLNGKFYANVFVHFEPIGPLDPNGPDNYDPVEDLPPYLVPGSRWAATWRHSHPNGYKGVSTICMTSQRHFLPTAMEKWENRCTPPPPFSHLPTPPVPARCIFLFCR